MTHNVSPKSTSTRTLCSNSKFDLNLLMKPQVVENPSPLPTEVGEPKTSITQRLERIPCTYPLWTISNQRSQSITRSKNRHSRWTQHLAVTSITISLNSNLRRKSKCLKRRGDPKSPLLGSEVHHHLWGEAILRVRIVASTEECSLRIKNLKSRSKEAKSH